MGFANMRVVTRLMAGFGLLIFALLIVGPLAIGLVATNGELHFMVDDRNHKVRLLAQIKDNL